ncbi:hypothetical protein DFJ77DRAFT_437065 [Powellomyces hirtus]|nr:hypothetical protein DFJ77DRAFT_437065 [Powellomyces hirtus]
MAVYCDGNSCYYYNESAYTIRLIFSILGSAFVLVACILCCIRSRRQAQQNAVPLTTANTATTTYGQPYLPSYGQPGNPGVVMPPPAYAGNDKFGGENPNGAHSNLPPSYLFGPELHTSPSANGDMPPYNAGQQPYPPGNQPYQYPPPAGPPGQPWQPSNGSYGQADTNPTSRAEHSVTVNDAPETPGALRQPMPNAAARQS